MLILSTGILTSTFCVGTIIHSLPSLKNDSIIFTQPKCSNQSSWDVVFPNNGTSIERTRHGWNMWDQGAISTRVCSPGTLSLTGYGDQAEGAPELTVILNGEVIAIESLADRRNIHLNIPRAGIVQLAYLNDLYRSEVRLGILADVRLNTQVCRLLDISVPKDNGGGYSPIPRVATLVGHQAATVTPCQSGKLTFIFTGRKAQGQFPRLRVEQGKRILAEIDATPEDQKISLPVSADPIRFRLLNPYARELADRNLYIRSLMWSPN